MAWFVRVAAGFGLALLAVTWRLWIPQGRFPQVPALALAGAMPEWCEWMLLALVVGSLLTLLVARPYAPVTAFAVFDAAMVSLCLVDQHRFQPWAWHLLIVFGLLAIADQSVGLRSCRWILVSIYFYSAVSKLDYQFVHTLGQQFLQVLCDGIGLDVSTWSNSTRFALALTFPLGELAVAAGLLIRSWCRLAKWVGVAQHVVLLLILGPFGLNHSWGVLIWNLFFVAQLILLFGPDDANSESTRASSIAPHQNRAARMLTGFVLLLPLGEFAGWVDHWPAWQLYAPRNSRARVFLLETAAAKLPKALQTFVKADEDASLYRRFDMDAWSLRRLNAPIYPQDRFQLGVAAGLAERYGLAGGIHVQRQGVSDRFTGARKTKSLWGRVELERELDQFWLNARPRRRTAERPSDSRAQ